MILKKFEVLKKENGAKIPKILNLKVATSEDYDKIYEFMIRVKSEMEESSNLILETREEMFKPCENGGYIFVLYDEDNNIAGTRYVSPLIVSKPSLADYLNINKNNAHKVVYLNSTIIDKNYTGNGLQYLTFKLCEEYCKERGYTEFISTISPTNLFSLYNGLKYGMQIRAIVNTHGNEDNPDGYLRYVLYADLSYDYDYGNCVVVKRDNLEKQKELIENGYVGVSLTEDKEHLNYCKVN